MMLHESETTKKMRTLEPIFHRYIDFSSKGGKYWDCDIREDAPIEAKEAFAEWCQLKILRDKEEDELCGGFAH